jgi:hypothetical protein
MEEDEMGMVYGNCGKKRVTYRFLVANLMERDQFKDNDTDGSY